MTIQLDQLQTVVNLHALHPDFYNSELHYVLAKSELDFRFAQWNDAPEPNERLFYCCLTNETMLIPAGRITLTQGFRLYTTAPYPTIQNSAELQSIIQQVNSTATTKAIRNFDIEMIAAMAEELKIHFNEVHLHQVASYEGQHTLLLVNDVEISIAKNMIYFINKTPFAEAHYNNIAQ